MFDVLAIGELNCDLIISGLSQMPEANREMIGTNFTVTLGSSTAICASGMRALGLQTAFCAVIGEDDQGRQALNFLQKNKVDTRFCKIDPSVRTGVTISMTDGRDRALVTYLGAMREFSLKDFDISIIKQARHIHVGSYFLQTALRRDLPEIFAYARENGVTTSLDTGWDDTGNWNEGIWDLLPFTDVFLPNETEALHITGRTDSLKAAEQLTARYNVVKCGADGAICWHNGEMYKAPSFLVKPVDTTGAGDSFNAGFIYGFLSGKTVEEALCIGNACGAVCVTRLGGASQCATLEDIEAVMRRYEH